MINTAELVDRARRAGVVPVLTVDDAACAVPLARALTAGGLDVMEITLRTGAALDSIAAIAASDIDCVIGAGTVLTEADVDAARQAGAEFLVTPGAPASFLPALQAFGGVAIPGVSTAGEAMALSHAGFDVLKFFPAEPAGGVAFLKALAGPLPQISFMPTGGIRAEMIGDYLALPNVVAVGGSWIAPQSDFEASDWPAIEARARESFNAAGRRR